MNVDAMNLRQFLDHLSQEGVTLKAERGQLRVRGRRLTASLEENLRRRKWEILALLNGALGDHPAKPESSFAASDPRSSPWFDVRRPVDPHTMEVRLFCFPWACGGAVVFGQWSKELPDFVETCAVKMPGRPPRGSEPPIRKLDELLDALEAALLPFISRPFVFYGHSMGSLVAFELARRLRRNGRPQPAHLLLGAQHALRESTGPVLFSEMPDAEFRKGWADLGGTPEAVLEYDELLEYYEPIFRADHELRDSYEYRAEEPLDIPISVYGGDADPYVSVDELEDWRGQTSASFEWKQFPGNHFFIESSRTEVMQEISRVLHDVRDGSCAKRGSAL